MLSVIGMFAKGLMFTYVALLILKVGRNNLSGHVYIFHVLLIFKVGRKNLNDHV